MITVASVHVIQQLLLLYVYLLTPMDRAMLLHAKSTISLCPLTTITKERALVDSKLLHRPKKCRLLAHVWMIMLKLHLVDIIQSSLQQIHWQIKHLHFLELSLKVCIALNVQGVINSSPSSTTLLISINSMSWRFFKVHSCAYKNGSHELNHAPFREDLSSLLQDLI